MSPRRLLPLLPVMLFAALLGFLATRLQTIGRGDAPNLLPSAMLDRPAPDFSLSSLFEGHPPVTQQTLKGKVTLVNIFASWCVPCRAEHPLLLGLKKEGVALVGINYKDRPEEARRWLEKSGNPYDAVGMDGDGRVGIDFGVYGVPESYLIDKQGVIRFKQTGPLTPEDIAEKLLPLAKGLNG